MKTKIMLYAIYLICYEILSYQSSPHGQSNILSYISLLLFVISLVWDILSFIEKKGKNKKINNN